LTRNVSCPFLKYSFKNKNPVKTLANKIKKSNSKTIFNNV